MLTYQAGGPYSLSMAASSERERHRRRQRRRALVGWLGGIAAFALLVVAVVVGLGITWYTRRRTDRMAREAG